MLKKSEDKISTSSYLGVKLLDTFINFFGIYRKLKRTLA